MDFLKNWKTTLVAAIGIIMGVVSQLAPDYQEIVNQLQTFLLAIIAFFAKDADKSGTTSQPR